MMSLLNQVQRSCRLCWKNRSN